jgi:uncharacterized spore protein YtfJ
MAHSCLADDHDPAYGLAMTTLTEKLAASVPSWGAKLAYAETITLGGQEVVPVALVGFGFGGGQGQDIDEQPEGGTAPVRRGEGSGGGGGGCAVPIGAYVAGPDGLTFRPNPVTLLAVAVPLVAAVGWALAQIINASRAHNPT